MGIVRYIASELTEAEPVGIETSLQGGYECHTRLKLEEIAYDKASKVSTVRVEFQVRTNAVWNNADTASMNGTVVSIGGHNSNWTMLPKTSGGSSDWVSIARTDLETVSREVGSDSCSVVVSGGDWALSSGNTTWTHGSWRRPAVKAGTYAMPLKKIVNGSVVYIGGVTHNVYIGNGSGLDRMDVYIGGARY